MKFDDYLKKNEKYEEFIHGLPAYGLFFTSTLILKIYNYDKMLDILENIQSSVGRLSDIGWEMKKFTIYGTPKAGSYTYPMMINHEWAKKDERFDR